VVTGASRGIGRVAALALADQGVDVVVASRTESPLEETARLVREKGCRSLAVPTDVRVETDCEALIARTIEEFGRVDILVNNAGGAIFRPFWELTSEELDYHHAVNVRGTFLCSGAAARQMMEQKSGAIVNIASSSGLKPYPTQAAYCAAKAGVIALSKVMALELRPYGVKVHVICPGGVDTQMAAEIHPHRDKTGWIQPEDIAQAVVYLLSTPPNITIDELAIRRFEADPI
jgi:NAD(P)-dependent dehydrogenase (short-subunit alcohol dehydrogenase family)